MSKLIGFDIIFAKNPPIFFSGQSVSGTVVVHLKDAMQMRSVRARIHGSAYSCVEVSRSRTVSDGHGGTKSESYTETYYDNETYVDHQVTLWGNQVGDRFGDNPVLPAGRYDFKFSFMLPTNIRMPSSFERGSCNIRYMITANIDKPGKSDHVVKRAFTLLESIDVNDPSLLLKPYPLQNEKFICCFCCKSGPLKLTGSIDRCGYCPGEGILINAECENLTNRKMRGIRVRLCRSIIWRAGGHSDSSLRTDFEIRSPGQIDEGASFSWNDHLVTVPSIPPTITSCRLISVKYELQISVVVPRGINLNVSFPIVIGTIPLRMNDDFPTQMAAPPPPGAMTGVPAPLPARCVDISPGTVSGSAHDASGVLDMASPLPGSTGPDPTDLDASSLPPPSYQASADGATEIKDSFVSDSQPQLPEAKPSDNLTIDKPSVSEEAANC